MKFFFAVCTSLLTLTGAMAQNQPRIVGNGDVVTKQRPLMSFHKLNVRVGMHVIITKGNEAIAMLEGDSNILDYVQTDVSNGELTVMLKPNQSYSQKKGVTVTLHVRDLDQIIISTGCVVESDLAIRAKNLTATVETGSKLTAPIDAKVLNLTVRQGSQAKLDGSVNEADIRLSGAGKLDADKLTISRATVRLDGASNASLHVTKTLSATADGISTISYRGNPTITTQQITGLSKIQKQG